MENLKSSEIRFIQVAKEYFQMKFARRVLAFVGCFAFGVFLSCASSIEQQTTQDEKVSALPNFEQITEIGKAATVQIGGLSIEGPPTLGSGFFIGPDLIVTNIHVISQRSFDGAVSVAKLVNKPTWYTIEGVVASDPKQDLVILKVTKVGGEDPHILSFGDSDAVKTGDSIIVIGNPRQEGKFVQGDVSRGTINRRTSHFFRVEATNIRYGYSGGPVLNVHGDVVGIISRGHEVGSGYAVPSNHLRALLKDMPMQAKSLEEWREEPLIRFYSTMRNAEVRGEFADAIKGYDAAIHLAPDFADAYINRGDAKEKLGDFEGAVVDYDMAIRLGADYIFVYASRGTARSNLGDHKGAIEDYDTAIGLKPEGTLLATVYINRSSARSNLGDHKGAIEDCNMAIGLKPDDTLLSAAYINRGDARSDLGDHKGAIEDCNMAIGLKPDDTLLSAAYNVRGKVKSAQGNDKDGIIDYDKAIQLEPNHAEFYYNRGVANAALGRTSAAETDLKTALKLLERVVSISKLTDEETVSVRLDVRSDLKADIQEALRLLK